MFGVIKTFLICLLSFNRITLDVNFFKFQNTILLQTTLFPKCFQKFENVLLSFSVNSVSKDFSLTVSETDGLIPFQTFTIVKGSLSLDCLAAGQCMEEEVSCLRWRMRWRHKRWSVCPHQPASTTMGVKVSSLWIKHSLCKKKKCTGTDLSEYI